MSTGSKSKKNKKTRPAPACRSGRAGRKIYGLELIMELFGCDLKVLTSAKKIREFLVLVCKEINLGRYGPPRIKRFMGGGLFGEGYSFFQFLNSSSITGHFIETEERIAFINIFSCGIFDPQKAANFSKKFFKAKRIKTKLIIH